MKFSESYIYCNWKMTDDSFTLWNTWIGEFNNANITICLDKTFRYLESINYQGDITYILPIIVRSIHHIKKFDPEFYLIENVINYINKNLQSTIKNSYDIDPEQDACSILSKEIAANYIYNIRKYKLNRILNEIV